MALFLQSETDRDSSGALPLLKAFIVYEDRAAGMHAKESFDHFVNRVEFDLEYSLDVCRFDLLEDSEMRQSTAQQAAEVDVVVVALHSGHAVPVCARDWLNTWLQLKGARPCALVILSCDESGLLGGTVHRRVDFAQIPTQANVAVFECVHSLEQTTFDAVLEQLRYRQNSSSGILEEILHQREPFSHWGIND